MNATGATQPRALLSLVRFLSDEGNPRLEDVDVAQIKAFGTLDTERRERALGVFLAGFRERYNSVVTHRLVDLMRDLRAKGDHDASVFLLDLFEKLQGQGILVRREQALQAIAETKHVEALDLWTRALKDYRDPLALSNVTYLLPFLAKIGGEDVSARLSHFAELLVVEAPAMAKTDAARESLLPMVENLTKAFFAHGFEADARNVGQVAIDLKMQNAFQL